VERLWDPAFKGRVAIPKWAWIGETWFHSMNRVLEGPRTTSTRA